MNTIIIIMACIAARLAGGWEKIEEDLDGIS
jgi:hypothetical protein